MLKNKLQQAEATFLHSVFLSCLNMHRHSFLFTAPHTQNSKKASNTVVLYNNNTTPHNPHGKQETSSTSHMVQHHKKAKCETTIVPCLHMEIQQDKSQGFHSHFQGLWWLDFRHVSLSLGPNLNQTMSSGTGCCLSFSWISDH